MGVKKRQQSCGWRESKKKVSQRRWIGSTASCRDGESKIIKERPPKLQQRESPGEEGACLLSMLINSCLTGVVKSFELEIKQSSRLCAGTGDIQMKGHSLVFE